MDEIATFCPLTVAYPFTGPCTVVRNSTGSPLSVPALKWRIGRHWPWYKYFASLPWQSLSTYWSMMSPLAEVSVVAKSSPRPIAR